MTKLLIVEDDPMISEIYQKKFSDSGFDVLVATSGDEAINIGGKEKVDAILLDLIMPKVDGFQVIENIRSNDLNQKTKIFVFSNLSQKEDQDRAIKLGANGFIVKSNYSPSQLVKEVMRLINQEDEIERNVNLKNKKINENENEEEDVKKKILLIEDEEIFLEMFGDKFKKDGFDVKTASNGVWGLKEALRGEYDIFIIDMMMPGITGDEIVDKLKMDKKTKNIPIIVLSASVENHIEDKVRKMGVNEFFIKTQIIPSELSKKVRELLEKR